MDTHYEEGVLHQELQMTIACKRYSATQMVENANQTRKILLSLTILGNLTLLTKHVRNGVETGILMQC